jgi:hypothetical protein
MIRQVKFNDQRDIPFACRLALECRAFQWQINRLTATRPIFGI